MIKQLFILLFVLSLIVSSKGYSQSGLEVVSRKFFMENANFGDTSTYKSFDSNKTLRYKSLLLPYEISAGGKYFKNTLHLNREKYRKDGTMKYREVSDTGVIYSRIHYDKKGIVEAESLYECMDIDSLKLRLTFKMLYGHSCYFYRYNEYKNEVLHFKGSYKKQKRDGVFEYYDKKTGVLKKREVYRNGKKQKPNKP